MNRTTYNTPLNSRYASSEMSYLFSEEKKFRTWRKLWVALAESEQINELKSNIDNINYEVAQAKEKEIRHDVNESCICIWFTMSGC